METIGDQLEPMMGRMHSAFAAKNKARETALPLCREALRNSANAIRAVPRPPAENPSIARPERAAIVR